MDSKLISASALPDLLPGEPARQWTALGTAGVLLRRFAELLLLSLVFLPFWPVYLLLRLFYERPPHLPSARRFWRVLGLILTARQQPPITAAMRVGLLLQLAKQMVLAGFGGCAWLLDELLYGRALRAEQLRQPVFEISAARSGSTQIAHYLEDDPHLCAPSVLQILLPYLWLWKLAPALSRIVSREQLEKLFVANMPPEHTQRHEMEPFRTDTFEIIYFYGHQLGMLTLSLGPEVRLDELHFARVPPASRELWEQDFPRFIDGLGRRTLLAASPPADGKPQHLFLKGHFLFAATALEQRYPDAHFLAVLRAPEKRLQSALNFDRCQPTEAPCPAIPWPWVVQYILATELDYQDQEMAWFRRTDGARRCVVSFDQFVHDLEGTMRKIYRECLDAELPPHIPRTHAPRVRTNYLVDRSLEQLGLDLDALRGRVAEYQRWCKAPEG